MTYTLTKKYIIIALMGLSLVFGASAVSVRAEILAETPTSPAAANTPTQNGEPDLEKPYDMVAQQILKLFAWLLGVAMITLDYSVYYTVVTVGSYVNDLSAVGVAWRIVRDIANIALIFGFIAAGISLIINQEGSFGSYRLIPKLLIAAILINFSLFMTEAVIDTGNLVATQIYTQIKGGELPTADDLASVGWLDQVHKEGVSEKIMAQLGMASIYGDARNKELFTSGRPFLIGFMGMILFSITAFVMFSLAFILIARFVILLLVIILSPIGLAGHAIPRLDGIAGQWRDALIQQTITAPVLMLLLYIALAIITDAQFLRGFGSGTPDWTSIVTGSNIAGFGGMILSFLIAIGLLLAVVMCAKRLSAFGAAMATGLASKLSGASLLAAAPGFAARSTVGWGLQAAARKVRSSSLGRVPIVGRTLTSMLDSGAKASFDVRGTKILDGLSGATGLNIGEAQKGGYAQSEKDAIKAREDHAASLTNSKADKEQIETEEGLIKALKGLGDKITKENKTEMDALRARHASDPDMISANNDVRQKRDKLKVAEASGNVQATKDANLALNNALLVSQKKSGEQKKEQEDLKEQHDKKVKENNDQILLKEGIISDIKKAPAIKYAKNIVRGPGKYLYKNEKASENIIKNAGKSKDQKDVDTLLDLIKKNSAGGKGTTPPPPPPPPKP